MTARWVSSDFPISPLISAELTAPLLASHRFILTNTHTHTFNTQARLCFIKKAKFHTGIWHLTFFLLLKVQLLCPALKQVVANVSLGKDPWNPRYGLEGGLGHLPVSLTSQKSARPTFHLFTALSQFAPGLGLVRRQAQERCYTGARARRQRAHSHILLWIPSEKYWGLLRYGRTNETAQTRATRSCLLGSRQQFRISWCSRSHMHVLCGKRMQGVHKGKRDFAFFFFFFKSLE